LYIYNSDRSKYSSLTAYKLQLSNSASSYYGYMGTTTLTANRGYILPDKDGTFAFTSDIPQHYNATTNPTGYLTLSDLPIYDGTVVQGGA
jgi:hypothetical protein